MRAIFQWKALNFTWIQQEKKQSQSESKESLNFQYVFLRQNGY